MSGRTAKLIAACGKVLPGETEVSLRSQWRRTLPRYRGRLRARWTHEVKIAAALARRRKGERKKRKVDRHAAAVLGKVYVEGMGAVPPPPGMTRDQFQNQIDASENNMRRRKR